MSKTSSVIVNLPSLQQNQFQKPIRIQGITKSDKNLNSLNKRETTTKSGKYPRGCLTCCSFMCKLSVQSCNISKPHKSKPRYSPHHPKITTSRCTAFQHEWCVQPIQTFNRLPTFKKMIHLYQTGRQPIPWILCVDLFKYFCFCSLAFFPPYRSESIIMNTYNLFHPFNLFSMAQNYVPWSPVLVYNLLRSKESIFLWCLFDVNKKEQINRFVGLNIYHSSTIINSLKATHTSSTSQPIN